MPLNLSAGGDADFTPYLKYNAKAGRFYVKAPDGQDEIEIEKPRLVFDMANIKTGWIYYQEGVGPEKIWDPSPTSGEQAPRPKGPQKWKRGFEVHVVGADKLPGIGKLGLREFSSTAANAISAVMRMYDDYESGAQANIGKVPFYVCRGVKPISGHYGTNYEPLFVLHAWIERAKVTDLAALDQQPVRAPAVASANAQRSNNHEELQREPEQPPPWDAPAYGEEIPF